MSGTLKVRGLNKSFGGIVVADTIDLDLHAGKVLGLIGPNGAGKTSLFNLISGIVRPESGTVELDDKMLNRLAVHKRARLGLSRTWQHVRLFPSLTVLDNLLIEPREYSADRLLSSLLLPARSARSEEGTLERARGVLTLTGLESVTETPAVDLTYGQQKLVGLARALMNEPRCLLLDEPMAGVEGQAYDIIKKVIRTLTDRGVAVCVVEHNVAFIRNLCDEGVFMFAGKVLARGSVEDLIADPRLTELYFGT